MGAGFLARIDDPTTTWSALLFRQSHRSSQTAGIHAAAVIQRKTYDMIRLSEKIAA